MPRRAFTLLETLAAITIIAVIAAISITYIGAYTSTAKREADKQTLSVLNDALTRYKTQGGILTALTSGASIDHVLTRLRAPLNWNGLTHQVMQSGSTYPSRSISAEGNGKSYRFTSYGVYSSNNSSTQSSQVIGSHGEGIGYISGSSLNFENPYTAVYLDIQSSTGYWALSIDGADPILYATGDYPTSGSGSSATFWACNSDSDPTPSGSITYLSCYGASMQTMDVSGLSTLEGLECYASSLTSLNVLGLSSLTYLDCSENNLSALSLTGCSSLESLYIHTNTSLSSINLSATPSLIELDCRDCAFSSLDLSGLNSLTSLWMNNNNISNIDISGLSALETLSCDSTNLSNLDVSGLSSLSSISCRWTPFTFDTVKLDAIYNELPTLSGNIMIGEPENLSDLGDTSIATNKGWTVYPDSPGASFVTSTSGVSAGDLPTGGIRISGNTGFGYNWEFESTTGYWALMDSYGNVIIADNSFQTASIPIKAGTGVAIWSCASGSDDTISGGIIGMTIGVGETVSSIEAASSNLYGDISISACNRLTTLDFSGKNLAHIRVSECPLLTSLDISSNSSLNYLYLDNLNLTPPDLSSFTSLNELYLDYMPNIGSVTIPSSVTTLGITNCNLTSFTLHSNSIQTIHLDTNSITSVDLSGCNSIASVSIMYNQLSSTNLDDTYTNLPTVSGATIWVAGNPGTSGDDPSIATAKGWVVSGS